jgi:hypothetical protein
MILRLRREEQPQKGSKMAKKKAGYRNEGKDWPRKSAKITKRKTGDSDHFDRLKERRG